jgi:hypothetical protein
MHQQKSKTEIDMKYIYYMFSVLLWQIVLKS